MTGYEKIKQLAKKTHCNITDLLVLAKQNDPFFVGSEASKVMAVWFANLWQEFGYTTGVHLRRFHYQLVSQGGAKKHNGKPYENTINDWNYLCMAGKYARHLGLIDPEAFIDRRNPEPHIFRVEGDNYEPSWYYNFLPWELPTIHTQLTEANNWKLPTVYPVGYEYDESLQPYHLEIWIEKSTMDDVLIPLCDQLNINLVTGIGFMSITSVVGLLKRVSDKPCRIFYISDFDPAGNGMPKAVARQIEYYLEKYAPGADIKLNPIALIREQVESYQLPRIPVKDSDKRKKHFEERYGEGAVELDAIEALYPGELANIVKENVMQFRDEKLEGEIEKAKKEAENELHCWWEEHVKSYQSQLDEIKRIYGSIVQKYQTKLEELKKEMDEETARYKKEVISLWQAIQKELDKLDPDLPELPEGKTILGDDNWLYDSIRDYFEQLEYYKAG